MSDTAVSPRINDLNQRLELTCWRMGLAALLMLGCAALYLSVYSGFIESGDALRLFDSATSWVRYGDFGRDESLWFDPPPLVYAESIYPLAQPEEGTTLLMYGLIATLYRLGDLGGLGYVHTVWLLNIFVTAASVGVLFWLVVALGWPERVALAAALLYGAATIALPYSKSLFREPLVTLALLLTTWAAVRTGLLLALRRWRAAACWAGLAGAGWLLGWQVKESVILYLPALATGVLLYGHSLRAPAHPPRWLRRLHKLLPLSVVALALLVYVEPLYQALMAFPPIASIGGANTPYPRLALHTYLFSVGGSIWGTSPVLLLALPGCVYLWRRGEQALIWFVGLLVISYAAGHALLTGIHWFGGLSWPPRFMVPTIPFVLLLALPVLEGMMQPGKQRRIWWGVGGLLLLYSGWIQFNAVALRWLHYIDILPPNLDAALPDVTLEWSDGLNRIALLRWVLLPRSWAALGLDIAWLRAGIGGWGIIWAAWALLALLGLLALLRSGRVGLRFCWGIGGVLLIWVGMIGGALRQLHTTDGLYLAQKSALHDVVRILQAEGQPGDILLLADNTYANFIMNDYRLAYPRPIILPYQPGERASDKDPVKVVSSNPIDYIYGDRAYYTALLLDYLPTRFERVWLLAHNSPFTPWAVRPIERYLGLHHYLLRVFETGDPTVRLLEYSLINAPNAFDFVLPDQATPLHYGEHLALAGLTLPRGTLYQPGDVLPLSLYWRADAPLPADYVVAWFLAQDGQPIVQGRDSPPYEGFAPTSTWQPGIPQWDHRALRIPASAAPGTYQLWVVVYGFGADGTPRRLPVTAGTTHEATIGVLPVTITLALPVHGLPI